MHDRVRLVAVTHAAFFLTGIVTTMLGPLLPELIRDWSLSDGQAGALFLSQQSGSLLGTLGSGWVLMPRLGFLRSLVLGAGLMALGSWGLTLPVFSGVVAATVVYGAGIGVSIPAANLLIADRFPQRRAAALNLLNLAWCLGAVISPPIIAWCLVRGAASAFLFVLALLLAAAALMLTREKRRERPELEAGEPAVGPRGSDLPRFLIALLLFLYVAAEIGTAGWIPTYAQRLGLGEFSWSWLQTTFWACLLAGRAASPKLLRRLSPPNLVLAGLLTSLLGESIFLASGQLWLLYSGVALTGLGLATIYPTTVATFSEFYGARTRTLSVPVFAMASLGGAAGPWLIGVLSEKSQNLRAAMGLLILTIGLMIALQIAISQLWKRQVET